MSTQELIVVLVHGWSVRNTDTYGELPARLRREARRDAVAIDIRNIWLSRYISFHDEVRIEDISRAFEAALRRELGDALGKRHIAIITHSTGGPMVRDWMQRHYLAQRKRVPISHLVMLAPANFGSPLAQLGASRLARLKTWFEGVEPGSGVLEWLELGSPESLALNFAWQQSAGQLARQGVYTFVLTGASIDHKLYDFVNSYTGEQDSDGVVRLANANLNFRHLVVHQPAPGRTVKQMLDMDIAHETAVEGVPFCVLEGRSHSGKRIGILRSIRDREDAHPTVVALMECLRVNSAREYRAQHRAFAEHNELVKERQRVEVRDLPGPFDRTRIKDPCSQLIFRVRDHQGYSVKDFELMLTADGDSPDRLPPGFFVDRQQNRRQPANLAYYLNAARMLGDAPVAHGGEIIREALLPAEGLGFCVQPYPTEGFVHYLPGRMRVSRELLLQLVVPHQTTVVDIVMHRVVHQGTVRLTRKQDPEDFAKTKPGAPLAE